MHQQTNIAQPALLQHIEQLQPESLRKMLVELVESSQALGELIHTWRETGVPPSLRELATANERLAFTLAGGGA